MQVCTSLQTDNHASTKLLSFLQAGCPSCCPTNSVRALKADHWLTNKACLSTVTTFLGVFTYKMAAKISWHRYGTKLHHCRPMYLVIFLAFNELRLQFSIILLTYLLLSCNNRLPVDHTSNKGNRKWKMQVGQLLLLSKLWYTHSTQLHMHYSCLDK